MASIEITDFLSKDNYRIIELDSTGEEGEFEYRTYIDPEALVVSVLVEGKGIEASVQFGGFAAEPEGELKEAGSLIILQRESPSSWHSEIRMCLSSRGF